MNEDRLFQLVREANEIPYSAESIAAGQRFVLGRGSLGDLVAARRADRLKWKKRANERHARLIQAARPARP
jgi:hypothetical protein